jgi:hypothetical protein
MSTESKRGRREEKRVLELGKAYFSSCSSTITPLPLLLKDELKAQVSAPITFSITQNEDKMRKILIKCSVIGDVWS